MFQYNNLLYSVLIRNTNGIDITKSFTSQNQGNNIYSYTFSPSTSTNWDDYYKVEISDIESEGWIRTIHVRLYYKLPYFATSPTEVSSGGIVFQDKDELQIMLKQLMKQYILKVDHILQQDIQSQPTHKM